MPGLEGFAQAFLARNVFVWSVFCNGERSASATSLSGFNVYGVATAPQFNPVTGMTAGSVTLGPTTTIQWQTGAACSGVANPGNIVMVANGVTTRLVPRVASGAFTVTKAGTALTIHVVTYSPIEGGGVAYETGDTTVAVRN